MNFIKCGIPIGAELVFIEDTSVKVTVVSERKVEYNNVITSLSAIADEIKGYSASGPYYFSYQGKRISDIAEDTQWKDY